MILLLITSFIFLPIACFAQNPICPMCSLGAQNNYNQGPPQMPQMNTIAEAPQTFSSFSRNPLSMYQGDAAIFGTELGRAIAQRIQQLYSQGSGMNQGNAYSSYPSPPPPSPYSMEVPLAPPVTEARALEYPVPAPARGGCPYCFGNQNNYGSNYGSYQAAAPSRPRRIEFVKRKEKQQ